MVQKERMSLMTFNIAPDLKSGSMKIEDILQLASLEGVHYVDLMNIAQEDLPAYSEAMQKTGVRLGCYIASVQLLQPEAVFLPQLRMALQAASRLKAPRLMIVPFASGEDLRLAEEAGREKVLQGMIRGFQVAVAQGEAGSMPICFETTPHEVLCLSGTEDCRRVLEAVRGLGLVFDTANMLSHGDDPVAAYQALKKDIVHVHLKDVALISGKEGEMFWERSQNGCGMQCVVWGQGVIPVKALYHQMLEDGYSGLFAIEYTHPDQPDSSLEEHRRHLQNFWRAFE